MAQSNITSGFIDIATLDEIEKYMYSGPDAIVYFVRSTLKSTWFTQIPVLLSRNNGNAGFGQEWSVSVSRAGDYLIHVWLRVVVPAVTLKITNSFAANGRLRWTKNFMHNLIRETSISFNDLFAHTIHNYHLDAYSQFTVEASKRAAYDQMIGNIGDMIDPHGPGDTIPSQTLNLVLPFFFTRDVGVSLPTAAIPYNEMHINFQFRDWKELLILDNAAAAGAQVNVPVVGVDIDAAPVLESVQVWANYAIVSNKERILMGKSQRTILIEQVQIAPRQSFNPKANPVPSYDVRFNHAVKALFFQVRNSTFANQWSNYTTASPVVTPTTTAIDYESRYARDPIKHTTLIYENSNRFSNMGSDYFSLVNPYYHAPACPTDTGYHLYSYSLKFNDLDPMGSTNYGKLSNVSLVPAASDDAIIASNGTGPVLSGTNFGQTFEFIVTVIVNNIIRIAGGTMGFPVL
jgi:hypothetical protein